MSKQLDLSESKCLPSSLVATRQQLEKLTEAERAFLRQYLEPGPKKANEAGAVEDPKPDSFWFVDTPEVRRILGIPW